MGNSLEIIECQQGSEAWHQARLGVLTASEFGLLLQKGRSGGPSLQKATYMRKLAAQRLTGKPPEAVNSIYLERGHVMEDEARSFYALLTGFDPQQVGFLRRGGVGCSPDSLIGDAGMLEIKTKADEHQVAVLLAGALPDEHKPQVQGQLWVAAREWCDFLSYWPGLPPLLVRTYRDETYIASLAIAAQEFLDELDAMVSLLRDYDWSRNYITQKVAA